MDLKRKMLVIAVLLFGILTFMIGNRVGSLDTECNWWVSRSPDPEMNLPDRISIGQIFVSDDKLIVEGDYHISEFVDSNSMLPTLDYGSNGIQILADEDIKLQIGDIISYPPPGTNISIVHRIVDIKFDEKGKYFVTKGDNNPIPDQTRVRREQVQRLTVGVLW